MKLATRLHVPDHPLTLQFGKGEYVPTLVVVCSGPHELTLTSLAYILCFQRLPSLLPLVSPLRRLRDFA